MKRNAWVFAALAISQLPACATIGYGEPQASRRVLTTSTADTTLDKHGGELTQEGSVIEIQAMSLCATKVSERVEVTQRRERKNESAGLDWTLGIIGAASLAVGGGLVIDSGNVHASDPTGQNYNEVGPDSAMLYGGLAAGVGAVLLTVAGVDVFRAQGEESRSNTVTEESFEDEGPCEDEPFAGGRVKLTVGAKTYELGRTDHDGRLRTDIDRVSADELRAAMPNPGVVRVSGQEVGVVHLDALLEGAVRREDEQAWSSVHAHAAKCAAPNHSTDCDRVLAYLIGFPDGVHAADAEHILEGSRATITALRAQEASAREWGGIDSDRCLEARSLSACDAVEKFTTSHPDGKQVAAARAILRKARPRLAALRDKLDRQRQYVEVDRVSAELRERSDGTDLRIAFDATKRREPGGRRIFHLKAVCTLEGRRYADERGLYSQGSVSQIAVGETHQISGTLFWHPNLPGTPTRCDVTIQMARGQRSQTLSELCVGDCE
jgi:hypothetical protein